MVHKPPFEAPYAWYAERDEYADTVFVKFDDDVVFIETDRFGDMLAAVEKHPNAVVSANVVGIRATVNRSPSVPATVNDTPSTAMEPFSTTYRDSSAGRLN